MSICGTPREQIVYIPTMLLDPPADDIREDRDLEWVRWLSEDIRSRGQQDPIRVRPKPPDRFEVIAGETRRRALLMGAIPEAMCIVVEREMDEARVLLDRFLENEARSSMTDIERAKCYLRLKEANDWSQDQLSQQVGKPPGTVSKILALLDLPPDLQQLVIEGKLATTAGSSLARLKDKPEEQATLAARFMRGEINRDTLAAQVSLIMRNAPAPAKPMDLVYRGLRLVLPRLPWSAMIPLMTQVLDAMKRLDKGGGDLDDLPRQLG